MNNNQLKFNDFKNLQFHIGKNLIKTKSRPNIQFKIDINEVTATFFKKNGLNSNRFVECSELLDGLELKYINKYNNDGNGIFKFI